MVTKPNNKIAIETKNTHTKIPFWAETKPNKVKRNQLHLQLKEFM